MEYVIVGVMSIGFITIFGNYILGLKQKWMMRDKDER
tara:strand:+ start:889 stop:999 length:111 start_codon:yes stop_codon:yes gene_type:complete